MNETTSAASDTPKLQPYLSPLAVWALSVGSAIGWGSLVVTSSSYLSQAGPQGSVIGLLVGFVMMLMVANHYHYLANRYPGSGGLYDYIKHIFGYDRAFLVSWFMFLVYISIFWANATSIPSSRATSSMAPSRSVTSIRSSAMRSIWGRSSSRSLSFL